MKDTELGAVGKALVGTARVRAYLLGIPPDKAVSADEVYDAVKDAVNSPQAVHGALNYMYKKQKILGRSKFGSRNAYRYWNKELERRSEEREENPAVGAVYTPPKDADITALEWALSEAEVLRGQFIAPADEPGHEHADAMLAEFDANLARAKIELANLREKAGITDQIRAEAEKRRESGEFMRPDIPEVRVEQDRIIIEHPRCRIIVEMK